MGAGDGHRASVRYLWLTATVLVPLLKVLLKAAIFSTVLMWLRRRWKWLATCIAAILAAIYLHAEFLEYVAALPAGSDRATAASGYIPLAFVLKNAVILGSLLAYFPFEVRRRRSNRRRPAQTGADRRRPAQTGADRRRPAEASSSHTAAESMPEGASASDTDQADDGFDFLRHGRKLESRAEKIIKRKPVR